MVRFDELLMISTVY